MQLEIEKREIEKRYEELSSKLDGVEENTKGIILSLLLDFTIIENRLNDLRKYPTYVVDEKNPKRQQKLPVHDIIKDLQAQKNDIATKILRSLDNQTLEESPLIKALAKFNQ